ncbi:unnamed protein product [Rhizoctonia solani]|uniref:Protein kinase domain-containing protein n=1 Tax=Rhizoctonia solani TaxID=456999 RepID=A0A8H3A1N3_9AGAM|nr:unnamed protein product [Rhizoctonia solani]
MIVYKGHTDAVISVAFSPDGKSVVSSSHDNTIRMWDARISSSINEPLKGHGNSVESVLYSPLGDTIASASCDKTIRLWDTNTRRQMGKPLVGNNTFYSLAFSPNSQLIASGCGWSKYNPDRCTVQLWDIQKMKAASKPFEGHEGGVESVQFSPDGSQIVSGSWDTTIRVWDIKRERTVVGPLRGHTDWVRSIALSSDGSKIITCSYDCTLRLWHTRTGATIGNPFEGHSSWVTSVAFSPHDAYVVSGGSDETVRLWDVRTGRQVQSFKDHASAVCSVAISPCGLYIASGTNNGRVIIRNIVYDHPEVVSRLSLEVISRDMSTQQIFSSLIKYGCNDLSSRMDTKQDTALIVSGGGFGDIWKGKLHNGRPVAIKAWRINTLKQCDYQTVKRAARELFIWSRMDHPNIHKLQGVIMFREQYLGMVSGWMDYGNLYEYLQKEPNADQYQLCVHVASGLKYMHGYSTIHGDLKAMNVLVSSDGVAKLSDFDFSVMSGASSLVFSESSNSRLGSARWAAPEILLADTPVRTKKADVYALGMVRSQQ